MLVSDEFEFVLFSNESTGSRAVYETLKLYYGGVEVSGKHTHDGVPERAKGYLPLMTCRDPFNRLVSAYHRIIQEPVGYAYYGYGVQWSNFKEFLLKYAGWFDSPNVNESGEEFCSCRWVDGAWMIIPWSQDYVYEAIVRQCGRSPVLIRQESSQSDLNAVSFYRGEALPVIGKSVYDLDEYRTVENVDIVRRCLSKECELLEYVLL